MSEQPQRRQRRARSSATVEQRVAGDVVEERNDSPSPDVNETGRVIRGGVGYVRIEGSVTQNMGDYNSVRVGVCAELPCDPTMTALDATADELSEFVDMRLRKEVAIATGGDGEDEDDGSTG